MVDKTQRVVPGGLFHTHKVQYSPETERFIRELIKESKLSIFQRKKVEESVRNGEPLPLPPSKTGRNKKINGLGEATTKYTIPRRRKKEDIQQSGAYERDRFTPNYAKANHDIEKMKLQEVMAYGRTLRSGKQCKAPQSLQLKEIEDDKYKGIELTGNTALDDLADDIDERKQFLARMESVGKGKEYREIINSEIQEKLRLADEVFKRVDQLKQKSESK